MAILDFNTPHSNRPARKKLRMALATIAIATSLTLSSTLAANINLNNENNFEFGQGIVTTTSCDDSILVTPRSSFINTQNTGSHKFSGISLSQVNTTSQGCAGKLFTIKVYDNNGDLLSPSYTIAVKPGGNFVSESGSASTKFGDDISDDSTLNFTSPTIAADDVFRITIESSEITICYGQRGVYFNGLAPSRAACSGYQLSQDFPSYTSGSYWIQNDLINNGNPLQIYADMITDDGGWTLIVANSANQWTFEEAQLVNSNSAPSDPLNLLAIGRKYSILSYADYLKKSKSGFQYRIDAYEIGHCGGIWTANQAYSFTSSNRSNTDVTVNENWGGWGGGVTLGQRMPFLSGPGEEGLLTTNSAASGYWWGAMIQSGSWGNTTTPWINGGGVCETPSIIWYWVR
jgi:hypothetical protein